MASKKKAENTSSTTKPGDATASKAAKQEDATVTCPVCAYQFKPGDPRL